MRAHLNGTLKAVKPYIGRLADERVWDHLREALSELQDAEQTATPEPATKTALDRLADERLWQHLSAALTELGGAAELARGRKKHRWGMLIGVAALAVGAVLVSKASRGFDSRDLGD